MKSRPSLCLALWLVIAIPLNAQIQSKPESILIHSTLRADGGIELEMSVSTKKQKYIRASIHTSTKTAETTIVFNGESVIMVEEVAQKSTSRLLSGEEAAANLFDLIALNPDYHHRARDGFNFNVHVFEDYRVEFQRQAEPIVETNRYLPIKMMLYEVGDSGDTLIRSIKYESYFDDMDPYQQPKEIVFTDESNGETGRITIQKVEYNVGLPDFLFEVPEPE